MGTMLSSIPRAGCRVRRRGRFFLLSQPADLVFLSRFILLPFSLGYPWLCIEPVRSPDWVTSRKLAGSDCVVRKAETSNITSLLTEFVPLPPRSPCWPRCTADKAFGCHTNNATQREISHSVSMHSIAAIDVIGSPYLQLMPAAPGTSMANTLPLRVHHEHNSGISFHIHAASRLPQKMRSGVGRRWEDWGLI